MPSPTPNTTVVTNAVSTDQFDRIYVALYGFDWDDCAVVRVQPSTVGNLITNAKQALLWANLNPDLKVAFPSLRSIDLSNTTDIDIIALEKFLELVRTAIVNGTTLKSRYKLTADSIVTALKADIDKFQMYDADDAPITEADDTCQLFTDVLMERRRRVFTDAEKKNIEMAEAMREEKIRQNTAARKRQQHMRMEKLQSIKSKQKPQVGKTGNKQLSVLVITKDMFANERQGPSIDEMTASKLSREFREMRGGGGGVDISVHVPSAPVASTIQPDITSQFFTSRALDVTTRLENEPMFDSGSRAVRNTNGASFVVDLSKLSIGSDRTRSQHHDERRPMRDSAYDDHHNSRTSPPSFESGFKRGCAHSRGDSESTAAASMRTGFVRGSAHSLQSSTNSTTSKEPTASSVHTGFTRGSAHRTQPPTDTVGPSQFTSTTTTHPHRGGSISTNLWNTLIIDDGSDTDATDDGARAAITSTPNRTFQRGSQCAQ